MSIFHLIKLRSPFNCPILDLVDKQLFVYQKTKHNCLSFFHQVNKYPLFSCQADAILRISLREKNKIIRDLQSQQRSSFFLPITSSDRTIQTEALNTTRTKLQQQHEKPITSFQLVMLQLCSQTHQMVIKLSPLGFTAQFEPARQQSTQVQRTSRSRKYMQKSSKQLHIQGFFFYFTSLSFPLTLSVKVV